MSENLSINATLTAHDSASPIIKGLLANVRKLEAAIQKFNASIGKFSEAGSKFAGTWSTATAGVSADIHRLAALNERLAGQSSRDWTRANAERLRSARSMYSNLEHLERG